MKFHSPTLKDIENRFYGELEARVSYVANKECPSDCNLHTRFHWIQENRERIRAIEKLKLLDEWEKDGKRTDAFSKDIMLIIEIRAKYNAEIMTKEIMSKIMQP